jgi:sugar O-acyltransferase (sialic acid O-acetyltransferase NeuD family)
MTFLTSIMPINPPDQPPAQILLYGASGHAKVVLGLIRALGIDVPVVFDDDPAKIILHEIRVVSPYQSAIYPEMPILIAIGNNAIRQKLAAKIQHLISPPLAHPSAVIDPTARFGVGTVVLHGAIVQADVQVGQHVIINTGASADHDCIIGDFAQLGPGAVLCGNVRVGEGTLIGAGAVLVPGVTVGDWATVGAGSVVTRNVPDGATVWGNPAKLIKHR